MLLRWQLYIFVLAAPLSWFVAGWGLPFTVGAALSLVNFYALAKIVQEVIFVGKGAAVTSLLTGFYLRLLLTGVVLFVMIGPLGSEIVPLLLGLSIVVVNILLFGVAQVSKKFKEAR